MLLFLIPVHVRANFSTYWRGCAKNGDRCIPDSIKLIERMKAYASDGLLIVVQICSQKKQQHQNTHEYKLYDAAAAYVLEAFGYSSYFVVAVSLLPSIFTIKELSRCLFPFVAFIVLTSFPMKKKTNKTPRIRF